MRNVLARCILGGILTLGGSAFLWNARVIYPSFALFTAITGTVFMALGARYFFDAGRLTPRSDGEPG